MKITVKAWSDKLQVDDRIVVQVADGEWWTDAVGREISRRLGLWTNGCGYNTESMERVGDLVTVSDSMAFYEHGDYRGTVSFSALMKFVKPK